MYAIQIMFFQQEEVRKLLEADFIREVYYLEWLANMVMVGKILTINN